MRRSGRAGLPRSRTRRLSQIRPSRRASGATDRQPQVRRPHPATTAAPLLGDTLLLRPRPASLLGESGEAEPDDGMGVTIGLSAQDPALRPGSSGAAIATVNCSSIACTLT
jgi:hypothetical protein